MVQASLIAQASTESVAPDERVRFWEEFNRRRLVGLVCSPHAEAGLLARTRQVRVGGLVVSDIVGNEHVVERTPQLCRSEPSGSVFASVLLDGEAVFYHRAGCHRLAAGEVVVYDAAQPYVFGFSGPMRQLLVDVPGGVFAAGRPSRPVVFGWGAPGERSLVTRLRQVLVGAVDGAADVDEGGVVELVRALLGGSIPGWDSVVLAHAREHVGQHVRDPGLDVAGVAAAVGVSTRHLRRVFARSGTSPARYLLSRRLAGAHAELRDPARAPATLSELAHAWGFSSHSAFTRAFRARFGYPPGAVRRHELGR